MGTTTAISWTDHTFNPWWGCTNVSPGCDHCYAETFAKRTGHDVWGKDGQRRFFGDQHWNEPLRWDRQAADAGERRLVFCASMADVFEPRSDLAPHRTRLFDLIEATPNLTWQLLTKRPEQVLRLVPTCWRDPQCHDGWPANCWIGTTVENQEMADLRIPRLLKIPAPVRFLSCEPLLGPVDLSPWLFARPQPAQTSGNGRRLGVIHWVIAGGESGPRHRPLELEHARWLQQQTAVALIPFFFKQHGGRTPTAGGHLLDGVEWHEIPA